VIDQNYTDKSMICVFNFYQHILTGMVLANGGVEVDDTILTARFVTFMKITK
jgi:hypothetical protein